MNKKEKKSDLEKLTCGDVYRTIKNMSPIITSVFKGPLERSTDDYKTSRLFKNY